MPLSGSRAGPAYDRRWVDCGMAGSRYLARQEFPMLHGDMAISLR